MIIKDMKGEFEGYQQYYNHGYPVYSGYNCIEAYKDVPEDEYWMDCPCCGLKPRIWIFDNGRSTACGCGKDQYDHFSVCAESIVSYIIRNNGSLKDYDNDQLRKNWNEYCATMVNPCSHWDLYSTRFLYTDEKGDNKW